MALEILTAERARKQEAPDGSTVHLLCGIDEGGTAIFELGPGQIARPVRHPRVQEVWYVLSGTGRIWRSNAEETRTDPLTPGTSIDIPRHTGFQFRNDGEEPLRILGVTAPPWKGDEDAELLREGAWPPTT